LDYGVGLVRLVVWDDGIGLPADHGANDGKDDRPGFGLVGMQERATLLGGDMNVSSVPDEGTRIEVTVPG
jgi:signal transduction histidine kinase